MSIEPVPTGEAPKGSPTPKEFAAPSLIRPHRRLLGVYCLRSLALCVFGPWFLFTLIPLFFKYKTLRYRFAEAGVGVSWGLLWKRETYLTYSRIQDIHVSRGIFERWLGLATIHVQTAAGSAEAEVSLLGLREHESVRDYLYSRMRGADLPDFSSGSSAATEFEAPMSDNDENALLPLLESILAEVQTLNRSLSSHAPSHASAGVAEPDPESNAQAEAVLELNRPE